MSAEAALTKISVAFRFCFDDVGIGARAVGVVSTYPVVIQCIGSQSGHVAIGYITYVQILVTGHEIAKISVRGHVQAVTSCTAYSLPVRGQAVGRHISCF